MAKAVRGSGEAGWQGTQQAGSGVEVLTHTGPGRVERIRSDPRLLQDPGAERANFRTAVRRGVACCAVGVLWDGACPAACARVGSGGRLRPAGRLASVKYLLRLAGAHVVGTGVGKPEARGLRRAPLRGHASLAPGESGEYGR